MSEKLDNIYLAVDVGYNIENVAKAYVDAFNTASSYMIIDYKCRPPTDDEIKEMVPEDLTVKKTKNGWQTIQKFSDNDIEIKKNLFVLVITEHKKIPEHLVKLRPKLDDIKFEVPKEIEKNDK